MRRSPSSIAAEARTLLGLAWPVALTSLNWTIMHLVDVAVVGHAGTHELDALAAARAVMYVLIVGGISALSGVLVFTARADGAGRRGESGAVLRAGLLHGGALGVGLMLVLLAAAPVLIAGLGVAPAFVRGGARVARVMALAFPAQMLAATIGYFLEGASRPSRVTAVNLAMLPLNGVLAWMLTGGHWGAPAWGAAGAAAATSLTAWIGLAALALAVRTLPDAPDRGVRPAPARAWREGAAHWRAVAGFGAMPALSAALELAGFSILIALSTRLGPVTAAAFQAVFSLHNFTFAIALGLSSAAGVRVGHAVGAGEPHEARPRAVLAAVIAFALTAMLAAGFALAAPAVSAVFSADPAVVALAAGLVAMLSPFMPFDGIQAVAVFALRSLGDQVAAGVNGILAYLLVTGGVGWALVAHGWGAGGLIGGFGAGVLAAAALQGGRLWRVTRAFSRPPARPRS